MALVLLEQLLDEEVAADVITYSAAISACQEQRFETKKNRSNFVFSILNPTRCHCYLFFRSRNMFFIFSHGFTVMCCSSPGLEKHLLTTAVYSTIVVKKWRRKKANGGIRWNYFASCG